MHPKLPALVHAALFSAGRALTHAELLDLVAPLGAGDAQLGQVLAQLTQQAQTQGLVLVQQASGWRLQTQPELAQWLGPLFADRPARMSRAQWETLAIIAWQQPVTRAKIEDVRGVALSSGTLRSLMDYEWIEVVGHLESPGRPALLATTQTFLDDFGLPDLSALPSLGESSWQQQELPAEASQMRFSDLLAKHLQLQKTDDGELMERLSQDLAEVDAINQGFVLHPEPAFEPEPETGPAPIQGVAASEPQPASQDSSPAREENEIIARMLAEQAALLAKNNRS